jgi:hypothetical protein
MGKFRTSKMGISTYTHGTNNNSVENNNKNNDKQWMVVKTRVFQYDSETK